MRKALQFASINEKAERTTREMFFVFGSPRSGTTLLAHCLSAHDEIVIPYETDFIVPLAFVFDRIRDPDIVRDIRDIVVSVNHWWNEQYLEQYFPRFWCNSNLYLHTVMRDKPAQYHLVRYEEGVQAPERAIAGVCAFLGAAFQPAMLAPEKRSPRYRSMPSHENICRPIDPAAAGRHRSVLTREQLDLYERQASEALVAFGYPTGVPG